MSDNNCVDPDQHHLHVCELKAKDLNEEVRKLFEAPARVACTNCGVKVAKPENVCSPKDL
jgi:hypothetical protein